METKMKLLNGFRRKTRQQARTPREKLHRSMAGETGALAALRLGFLVN